MLGVGVGFLRGVFEALGAPSHVDGLENFTFSSSSR
jgi:hypothetical protein